MGKIRTRFIGQEDIEKEQKQKQKIRSEEKKLEKKKVTKVEDVQPKPAHEEKVKAPVENVEEPVKKEEAQKKEKKPEKKSLRHERVRGKKYVEAKKLVNEKELYPIKKAVELVKKMSFASFDESVELHINVISESLKGEVELPHTTGKTIRVAVVSDELLEKLEKGIVEFDVLITHPSFMPRLAKYARSLGPRGLMPNPKAGTVSTNPEEAIKKFEKGMLRWKTEPKGKVIHQMIGKKSHDSAHLEANVETFLKSVGPLNITAVFIKTTMSPAVKIELTKLVE